MGLLADNYAVSSGAEILLGLHPMLTFIKVQRNPFSKNI